MNEVLIKYYKDKVTPEITTPSDLKRIIRRLSAGNLTREENPLSHLCAMALIYDPETKKVFMVLHKKAKSWIFPGGHIEIGELPTTTIVREINEETGLERTEEQITGPFSAQVLDINNPPQVCREHYDLFYAVAAAPTEVEINMTEFLGAEWLPVVEARQRITLEYYKQTLDKFVKFINW
jgi:8-oxo-dGTP pyrophosphatase MutT (NUDIX family)